MRNDRSGSLKGVASTDAHLVDDENGWERCMAAMNVEPDGFTMVWLKYGVIGVVDEHEFANLSLLNTWPEEENQLTLGMNLIKTRYLSNPIWWFGHMSIPLRGSC